MYRDDAEAARSRIESLEAELQATQRRIAEFERAATKACTISQHEAQVARVTELEAKVAALAPRTDVLNLPPEQVALIRETEQLRADLADLQLLESGEVAVTAELDRRRAEIARLDAEILEHRAKRALERTRQRVMLPGRVRPRTLTQIPIAVGAAALASFGAVSQLWPLVTLSLFILAAVTRWWRVRVVVQPNGLSWSGANYTWDDLRAVKFLPSGDLRLRFKATTLTLSCAEAEFATVVAAALATASRRKLAVKRTPKVLPP